MPAHKPQLRQLYNAPPHRQRPQPATSQLPATHRKTPGRFSIYLGFCTVRPEGFEPPTF